MNILGKLLLWKCDNNRNGRSKNPLALAMGSVNVEGKTRDVFFKYLIPSMLSMLAVSVYAFVDTFVVGQGIGGNSLWLGIPVGEGCAAVIASIMYLKEKK